jgi:hypothetical protein
MQLMKCWFQNLHSFHSSRLGREIEFEHFLSFFTLVFYIHVDVGSGERLQKTSGKVRTWNNTGPCCHSNSVQSTAVIISCSKTSFSPLLILGISFLSFHFPQSKLTKQTNPRKDYNAFIADFHGASMFWQGDTIWMERISDYCMIGKRHPI